MHVEIKHGGVNICKICCGKFLSEITNYNGVFYKVLLHTIEPEFFLLGLVNFFSV